VAAAFVSGNIFPPATCKWPFESTAKPPGNPIPRNVEYVNFVSEGSIAVAKIAGVEPTDERGDN
jgi:hypothetical protein